MIAPIALLIDQDGRCWSDNSSELAHRIDYPARAAGSSLPAYAVRECGFIHLRVHAEGLGVSLRKAAVSRPAIAGLMYAIGDVGRQRVLLSVLCGETWEYELHSDLWDCLARIEDLSAQGPIELARPWLATPRPIAAIRDPRFAEIRDIVTIWTRARGRMSEELAPAIADPALRNRTILIRRPARSSRLVVEHFGASITILRPCESFLLVGRDFSLPDSAYQAWCEDAYDRAIGGGRLRLESAVARMSTSEAATVKVRYDRLLMPLSGAGGDRWMLCVSMRRELSRVA